MTLIMKKLLVATLAIAGITSATLIVRAQEAPAADGPRYTEAGQLQRPLDYREWVYLTSSLGVSYSGAAPAANRPQDFKNIFVNRESYKRFVDSGKWPEKTMFLLEVRQANADPSVDAGGRTQTGVVALEAAVKDSARFPGLTWAYFSFDSAKGLKASADRLPDSANCYACHRQHTAVEQTFVQFYPTLFDIAKQKGTVKPTYDPAQKIR
jgi:hypothetical protein